MGGKRPRHLPAGTPDGGKTPRSSIPAAADRRSPRALPADPTRRTPVWAFRIVDLGGPWCWSGMAPADIRKVLDRLRNFETMSWREIDGRSGSHGVAVERIIPRAQKRLVELKQDDAAELFSLRIDGPARVWGIRDEHVLRILWWDPHHQVCPAPKKHT
jgi:hypothetical protein